MCSAPESWDPAGPGRSPDLGEIVRRHAAAYQASHPVSPLQQQVLRALASCRTAALLPIAYFHVVFTLPQELRRLALAKPRVVYGLLFTAASKTLQTFARDPKHLGGEIGITAILHTWSQTLALHPHLHCVVTGGALASDGSRWVPTRHPGFLFPVRALAKVFRGKLLDGLTQAFQRGELGFRLAHVSTLRA